MRAALYALTMWFSGVSLLRSLYNICRVQTQVRDKSHELTSLTSRHTFRISSQTRWSRFAFLHNQRTPPYNPRAGRFVHRARMWAYLSLTPRRFKWWQSARPAYKTLQNDETPNNVKYNTSDNDLRHLTMIKIIDDLRLTITLAIILLYYKCIENYGRPSSSTLWISNKLQTFTDS